jgi:hypothetical protein
MQRDSFGPPYFDFLTQRAGWQKFASQQFFISSPPA